MTYVVTEACIKCKYTDCVEVCPVDCFYEGDNMLVIHPDECIDCGVCEPECPADAIKPAIEKRKLDEKQSAFVLKNAAKFNPASEETLTGDLDKFLDAQLDDLKTFNEIYGIKASGGATAAGVGAGKADDTSVEDYLTPDEPKDDPKK